VGAYDTSSREEGSFGWGAIATRLDQRVRPASREKRGHDVTLAVTDFFPNRIH